MLQLIKLKKLQVRRIENNYRGGFELMKNVGHYGCLINKYCLQWLEILLTFVGVGDVSFYCKPIPI